MFMRHLKHGHSLLESWPTPPPDDSRSRHGPNMGNAAVPAIDVVDGIVVGCWRSDVAQVLLLLLLLLLGGEDNDISVVVETYWLLLSTVR